MDSSKITKYRVENSIVTNNNISFISKVPHVNEHITNLGPSWDEVFETVLISASDHSIATGMLTELRISSTGSKNVIPIAKKKTRLTWWK